MTKFDPMNENISYERIDNDFYPTETWATRTVVRKLLDDGFITPEEDIVWECACGEGHISKVLLQHNFNVHSSDLIDRGYGDTGVDFLKTSEVHGNMIFTNPPYGDLAEEFISLALDRMNPVDGKVIMLLRNEYDCAKKRRYLFGDNNNYAAKFVLTSRPRWVAGSKGSPRHNYSWYYWDMSKNYENTSVYYLDKCETKH